MQIRCKSRRILWALAVCNAITAAVVAATFVLLEGFDEPLWLSVRALHIVQIAAFFVLVGEKFVRFLNAVSKREFFAAYWFEIPLLAILIVIVFGAHVWFDDPGSILITSLNVYLIAQVVIKACRSCVYFAAKGESPTTTLLVVFLVLIVTGAGLLMLPRSHNLQRMSLVDALFTSTSATCVTGLIVKDTGTDFTLMGQIVILVLIQLGGLGIVIFGAVIALLLGQALSVRESVAMQDLLSTQTLGRISRIIGFIIIATFIVEALGAFSLLNMWDDVPCAAELAHQRWFSSIFHSISAFCNAGFSLYNRSLIDYNHSLGVYAVISPLIVMGGLGFGVLYDLFGVFCDRVKRLLRRLMTPGAIFKSSAPVRFRLQTKIVLATTLILIVAGTMLLMTLEHYSTNPDHDSRLKTAFFQSVTARTAGFNTVDVSALSDASKLSLMVLMFIGGSPGSTAGGIKTVTLAVLIMVAWAILRKRSSVELFQRSVHPAVVGRAITITLLFAGVFLLVTFLLSITERNGGFRLIDVMFETGSALGTVGLTTGITPSLTTWGKLIIIATMFIGRLGPLTLLATITFNLKPARYDYPAEPVIVG